MIQSVFTIGIILTVITVALAVILPKISFKGIYTMYIPFFTLFIIGLLLLLFATILEKQVIMGAGLGGWGIACIFAWPGIGLLFMDAAFQRDYTVIMAVTVIAATLVVIGNLVADILYAIFDPRIEY